MPGRGAIDETAARLRDVHWSFAVQERFIHACCFAGQASET